MHTLRSFTSDLKSLIANTSRGQCLLAVTLISVAILCFATAEFAFAEQGYSGGTEPRMTGLPELIEEELHLLRCRQGVKAQVTGHLCLLILEDDIAHVDTLITYIHRWSCYQLVNRTGALSAERAFDRAVSFCLCHIFYARFFSISSIMP